MPNDPAPSTLWPNVLRQVESLRDQFQADWTAGRRPALESYLGQVAHEGRPLLLRELLKVELDHRGRAGRPPSQDEYRRRLAHLGTWVAPLLTELFAAPADRFRVTLTVTEGPHRGPWEGEGNGRRCAAAAYPVADFYEPVAFVWTEPGYEVRQALQKYSEATHADPSDVTR